MQPLDYKARIRITKALADARLTGADEAEYLHRYGLAATVQWRDHVRGDMVRDLRERLRSTGAPFPPSFFAMLEGWEADVRSGEWRDNPR